MLVMLWIILSAAITKKAISLRPYRPRLREDKTVNTKDLRLGQISYFTNKMEKIRKKWRKATQQKGLLDYTAID